MDDAQPSEPVSSEELRQASFPSARKGYDRAAVHELLDRVANSLDARGEVQPADGAEAGLDGEFAKVGERTAGILTAAEEAAAKLRSEAKEHAERLRAEAQEHADRVRSQAEELAKRARTEAEKARSSAQEEAGRAREAAEKKSKEIVAAAEAKAEGIIEDTVKRRRGMDEAVASLIQRRHEIAEEAQRLANELLEMVDSLREQAPFEDGAAGEPAAGPGPDFKFPGRRQGSFSDSR